MEVYFSYAVMSSFVKLLTPFIEQTKLVEISVDYQF